MTSCWPRFAENSKAESIIVKKKITKQLTNPYYCIIIVIQ